MTHDHSALLAQLDALKSADVGAVIRAGLQALIEAEATDPRHARSCGSRRLGASRAG